MPKTIKKDWRVLIVQQFNMKERKKIHENLIRLDKLEVGSKKESEERLKNIIKNLDKALDLKK